MINVSSIKAKIKVIDYRHYIAVALTLVFALLGVFVYKNSYIRLFEVVKDFIQSAIKYFSFLFTGGNVEIGDLSLLNGSSVTYPIEILFEEFKLFFVKFYEAFISLKNFKDYLSIVFKILFLVTSFGSVFVLIMYLIWVLFKRILYNQNQKIDYEPSKPLKIALLLGEKVYLPFKRWCLSFMDFLKNYSFYLKLWLVVWVLNLNVVSTAIATFAFLMYFAISYNVSCIPFQLFKLFLDVTLIVGGLPLICWIIILIIFYVKYSVKIGKKRLQRIEAYCEKFVKCIKSVVVFFVGKMGKGKTKVSTDMSLTQRNIFRNEAFKILRNRSLEFPQFPWVKLERYIQKLMNSGLINKPTDTFYYISKLLNDIVYSKTIKKAILRHNKKFQTNIEVPEFGFGYDYKEQKTIYNNGIYLQTIVEAIMEYSQAYFVYTCDNINVANYSIRFDDKLVSLGHFPLWDNDFFNKSVEDCDANSRYAHILDFDMMRMTRKVREDLANGLLTMGVINITEIGKERGNKIELEGIKRGDDKANQKNDGFNKFIKFCRHVSTICFYPFIKVFVDDQRPESWGADGKDLTEIIRIGDEEETRCALPAFGLIDNICNKILSFYDDVYYKYRFYRSDRTLLIHAFKLFVAKVYDFWTRCHNKYDYTPITLYVGPGTEDAEFVPKTYYLASHKIYSQRYSTDCYAEIFRRIPSKGINNIPCYNDIKMSTFEFKRQKSYLYEDLDGISKSKKRVKYGNVKRP